jgi:hypothetical protein
MQRWRKLLQLGGLDRLGLGDTWLKWWLQTCRIWIHHLVFWKERLWHSSNGRGDTKRPSLCYFWNWFQTCGGCYFFSTVGVSEFNLLISHIQSLLRMQNYFEIKYVSRQANKVVHYLARAAFSMSRTLVLVSLIRPLVVLRLI